MTTDDLLAMARIGEALQDLLEPAELFEQALLETIAAIAEAQRHHTTDADTRAAVTGWASQLADMREIARRVRGICEASEVAGQVAADIRAAMIVPPDTPRH